MNDEVVFFWIKQTSNKNLDKTYLCPYCKKLFSDKTIKHPCLFYTRERSWKEIFHHRSDCIYFTLYKYNPDKTRGK